METKQERTLRRQKDFWAGNAQDRPLTCAYVGSHFFSTYYRANAPLLAKGRILKPEEIAVAQYMEDYERLYTEHERVDDDSFFTAEPCTGFPWLEGMLGAEVMGAEVSFIAHPRFASLEALEGLQLDTRSPWYEKYLEFCDALTRLSAGRFPVGQPILRGVSDVIGSLIGQAEMICELMDEPETMQTLFAAVADAQRKLIAAQYEHIEPFLGGYSIGFYHLWTPGRAIWFQDDMSAMMSPRHHAEFLAAPAQKIMAGYDYTLFHLHPASFFHLESILSLDALRAVQINKDVGGPSMADMLPQFERVLASGKRLVIGMSPMDKEDIDVVFDHLPHRGVALTVLAKSVEEANELLAYMDSKRW